MKKKNIIEFKQPQELFCSIPDCTNSIAKFHHMFYALTRESLPLSNHYCLDCIVEEKYKDRQ